MPRTKSIERDKNKDEHVPTSEVGKELNNKEKHRIGNKKSAQAFRSRQKGVDIQILYGLIANADLANLDQLKHEKERLAREVKMLNDERKQLRNENKRHQIEGKSHTLCEVCVYSPSFHAGQVCLNPSLSRRNMVLLQ